MTSSDRLDNPFHLARALEPWARLYLKNVQGASDRGFGVGGWRARAEQAELASKSRYEMLKELNDDDPLKAPLLRWVHRMTEMRVNQLWLEEDERLYRTQVHPVREPRDQICSLAEMKKRALGSLGSESVLWWDNLTRFGRGLYEHRVGYLRRAYEVHQRLGEVDVLAHFSPLTNRGRASDVIDPVRPRLAELLEECEVSSLRPLVDLGCGPGLKEGWPARLAPDSLSQLISAPELFRGVSPEPGKLPSRLVPASFLRAAYQVGRSLSLAWAPPDRPLLALRDPDDLLGHRVGWLFVLWQLSAVFDHKTLGLSRGVTAQRRRGAAQVLLSMLVLQFLRTQWFECGLDHRPDEEDEEALGQGLFARPLPANAPGVWWSVRRNEQARCVALLDAAAVFQDFVDEFDTDWWRNPRALEKMRAEHSAPATTQVNESRAQIGRDLLLHTIEEGLRS